ncbi:MAG: hypothetical protein EWM47_11080 [Anaerolineaceae bacterium]|nr:MAG: hypothetical protein EWM47_11080 [Anaerolineaceae bacterium]
MRNFIYKYRSSKFKCFLNGLVFAILSVIAMFLCINILMDKTASRFEVLFPFCFSIISMLLGFISMFKANNCYKGARHRT